MEEKEMMIVFFSVDKAKIVKIKNQNVSKGMIFKTNCYICRRI